MSGAVFADVTSANVVGYMGVTRPQVNFASGPMFTNIGGEKITLADLKITGVTSKNACRNNTIVFMLAGNTAKLDAEKKFWMDIDGNWRKYVVGGNPNTDPILTDAEKAAVIINEGEGLICGFGTPAAEIVYCGEVITGTEKKLSIPRPQVNFVVANPSGRTVDLTEVAITGVTSKNACRNNTIVFMLAGNTAKLDAEKKFWMDIDGNWRKYVVGGNPNTDPVLTEEEKKAVTIGAGQGIICGFGTPAATITFPTAL